MTVRMSAFLHFDECTGATTRLVGRGGPHCLQFSEPEGNEVYVFLSDEQLARLHHMIGDRLAQMQAPAAVLS